MAFFTLEDHDAEIECIVFPKTLTDHGHLVRADNVVRVTGNFSVREDENPKILVSAIEELPDNDTYVKRAQQSKSAATARETARPIAPPSQPRILYLRVPDMQSPLWKRAKNLLEIFEGALPVSVFDASDKSYHKQKLGFDCTAYTIGELQKILGADNVVLK